MAPKKRGRPPKAKKDVDTAPIVIPDDDEDELDLKPPQKKAKGNVEDFFQSPVKKQTKDAQLARTKGLTIPVDDNCMFASKLKHNSAEALHGKADLIQ